MSGSWVQLDFCVMEMVVTFEARGGRTEMIKEASSKREGEGRK